MTLSEYIAQKRGTAADLARTLGVQHSTVVRWADGTYAPSLAMCQRIATATNGAVTVSDFMPTGDNDAENVGHADARGVSLGGQVR